MRRQRPGGHHLRCEISIHAPTWGATRLPHQRPGRFSFQSTHPRGVRREVRFSTVDILYFNPRTHVGCDLNRTCRRHRNRHFNPRTHVGCDVEVLLCHYRVGDISIHAPTWGATLDFQGNGRHPGNFNPRTHVGCDRCGGVLCLCVGISIHAPTWGATSRIIGGFTTMCISIHAPTWGATFGASGGSRTLLFQSTHPRGVRHTCNTCRRSGRHFNPRTHVGCDFRLCVEAFFHQDFNPRTHVGCDLINYTRFFVITISIHAPTWGATNKEHKSLSSCLHFNPRTHVGCDGREIFNGYDI